MAGDIELTQAALDAFAKLVRLNERGRLCLNRPRESPWTITEVHEAYRKEVEPILRPYRIRVPIIDRYMALQELLGVHGERKP